jgi:type I restriction enzyme S subunit
MHQGLNTAGEKVKFVTSGTPILQTRNITSGKIDFKNMKYLDEDTFKKYSDKFRIKTNDILLANIGTIGKSLIVNDKIAALNVLIHWNIFKIQLNHEKINHKYFNYYLNYLDKINYYSQFQKGGTVNFISKKFLNELQIPLPSKEIQNQIVKELDGYQKIIDGCKQVIENYKPTFEIETHWDKVKLKDVAKVINGRAYKQSELLSEGKYKVLRVGNFFSNNKWYYSNLELNEDKFCNNNDLLYAWSASFGANIWKGDKTIYHYHIWKVVPDENKIDKKFLYYYLNLKTEELKREGGRGMTMMHLTKDNFEKQIINLPSLTVQKSIVKKLDNLESIMNSNIELMKIFSEKLYEKGEKIWSN